LAIEFRYTPEQFKQFVMAYHKRAEEEERAFPDLAGLKNALGLENEEYDAYAADPAYSKICLWAMRRRESFLNRAALTAKNTTGIKMLLAQPENGGYVEKPIDKTPRQIEVRLRGMVYDDGNDPDDSGSDSIDSDERVPVSPIEDTGTQDGTHTEPDDKPRRKAGRPKKQA